MRKAWMLFVIGMACLWAATSAVAQTSPDAGKAPAAKDTAKDAAKKDAPAAQPEKKQEAPPAAEAKKNGSPPAAKTATKSKRVAKAKRVRHARGHRGHRHAARHHRRQTERGIWVYRAHSRHAHGYVYVRRTLGGFFAPRGRGWGT